MRFSRPFSRKSRTGSARRASAAFPLPPLSSVSSEDDAAADKLRGESVGSFAGWRRKDEEDELRERVRGLEVELRNVEQEREDLKRENQALERAVREVGGDGEGSVVARMRREVERLQWRVKEGSRTSGAEEQGDLMTLIAKGGYGEESDEEEQDWREREIERLEEVVMKEWEEKVALEEVVRELEERVEGREREIREGEEWKEKWRKEKERVVELERVMDVERSKWADRPRSARPRLDRPRADKEKTVPKRRLSWMGGGAGFFSRTQSEI